MQQSTGYHMYQAATHLCKDPRAPGLHARMHARAVPVNQPPRPAQPATRRSPATSQRMPSATPRPPQDKLLTAAHA